LSGSREYRRRSFLPTTTPDWIGFVLICGLLAGLGGIVVAVVNSSPTQSRDGYWGSDDGRAIRDEQEYHDAIIPRGR
jgi:hypothetical protein